MQIITDREAIKSIIEDCAVRNLTENINLLPERMNKGLSLIYPERQASFLDELLERTKNGYGAHVGNALEVMEALENGATVEEADQLVKDYGNFSKQIIRGYVLGWSKRGPEFYRGTLPCNFYDLPADTIQEIEKLEEENLIFATAEKERKGRAFHLQERK